MRRQLSQFDFHQVLAEQAGPALVVFTHRACGACRHLRQVLAQVPELAVYEVDAERDSALVREFGVFHLPALFLYHGGAFHRSLHCAATPAALRAAVRDALRLPAEQAP